MGKKNVLVSVLGQKCPRCRQGDLFQGKAYGKGFNKMRPTCDSCGQSFTREPGFYDGAMYVSYALQVALLVSVLVAFRVLYPEAEAWMYIATLIFLVLALFPLTFRLSRTIWIYFFVKYDKKTSQDQIGNKGEV